MKLSTKVRYGLRAMVELAKQPHNTHVSLRSLAENQHISSKYLEQIVFPLKSAGLIKAVRGAEGGYCLTRPAREISAWDICSVLDSSVKIVDCIEGDCQRKDYCGAYTLWSTLQRQLEKVLQSYTLKKLAQMEQKKMELFCHKPDKISVPKEKTLM